MLSLPRWAYRRRRLRLLRLRQEDQVGRNMLHLFSAALCLLLAGSVTPAGISHSKEPSGEFVPQQIYQPAQQFNEFVPGQAFITQQQVRLISIYGRVI